MVTKSDYVSPMLNISPLHEKFEDTKVVIRSRYSVEEIQLNYQMKKNKKVNNDLQNTTQKTKDRAIRSPLKTEMNSDAPEG